MKWLEGNPLAMVLVAISGVFALMVLVMGIVWTLPVSVETADMETENSSDNDTTLAANKIGSLGEYQVINQKPVFNESRQPLNSAGDDSSLADASIEVKDAPDVKLTGVIITPGMKIASLTPADGNLESVMAHEGQSLTGEFVGWQVSKVNPRTVILESRNGEKLELELQVHDAKIKEPPAPAVPVQAALAASNLRGQADDEDDEPLSRAEQIRQRIAERREELRLEQEAQKAPNETNAGSNKPSASSQYQNAIRASMKNRSKDKGGNDNNKDR
jgi:hypothetical protein